MDPDLSAVLLLRKCNVSRYRSKMKFLVKILLVIVILTATVILLKAYQRNTITTNKPWTLPKMSLGNILVFPNRNVPCPEDQRKDPRGLCRTRV